MTINHYCEEFMTPEEREARIKKIEALPQLLEAAVKGLAAEQLTTHYLDGEWNVAQNVHHLADSHLNSFIRLKLILSEDQPTLKPYYQDMWAAMPDGDNVEIEDSLAILRGLHARWVRLLRTLTDDQWMRTGYHPENGNMTPVDLLRVYAGHGEGHIDQIQRTLAAALR
jgi:hypothetical protein